MVMNLLRSKSYYEMSQEQFDDMKAFYEKLGYSEKQVKKLCSTCFGAEIKVAKNCAYAQDWSFYRSFRPSEGNFGIHRKLSAPGFMGGAPLMARACVSAPVEDVLAEGCVPMAAPMPAAEPAEAPEFNTASAHDTPENECHSPIDQPQLIFSANVNTASWSYIRSRICRSKPIDKSFIRIEEIINSYPYKLKKAKGEELFSVSAELAECPWEDGSELLFVGLKGKKADKRVRQNLAFLVDVSGSMEDEWILVQMSLAAVVSKLGKGDTMSIIAYSDNTVTVAKQLDCKDMDECVKAIMSIDGIGGCTNGSDGLENAYKFLGETFDEEANNRVFIFTDGDFNFGLTSEGSLRDFIYKKRETGIYLSIVGYGERNFKDDKMETLARNGNGNYTFVSNPMDILDNLWKKLVSNLVTVAKDVKISVELNPAVVKEYRLIGYDARILTQQEFHDTEKAVDGIGSQHNVAALIQLKRGTASQQYSTRYTSTTVTQHSSEFAFIEIHYKSPDDENLVMTKVITTEELRSAKADNIPAAAMLAAFGMLLKNSDYKGIADKQMLRDMLSRFEEDKEIKTDEHYSHFDIIRKYISR